MDTFSSEIIKDLRKLNDMELKRKYKQISDECREEANKILEQHGRRIDENWDLLYIK